MLPVGMATCTQLLRATWSYCQSSLLAVYINKKARTASAVWCDIESLNPAVVAGSFAEKADNMLTEFCADTGGSGKLV